ncbi:hypothetical protein ACP275_06G165400 [Erythranthe tilingii]
MRINNDTGSYYGSLGVTGGPTQPSKYYILRRVGEEFVADPAGPWYKFHQDSANLEPTLYLDEAERMRRMLTWRSENAVEDAVENRFLEKRPTTETDNDNERGMGFDYEATFSDDDDLASEVIL